MLKLEAESHAAQDRLQHSLRGSQDTDRSGHGREVQVRQIPTGVPAKAITRYSRGAAVLQSAPAGPHSCASTSFQVRLLKLVRGTKSQ